MHKVVAMILAGGRGKRMDILCQDRPKPALPFAGKFRVIDFSLSNCVHSEINHIALLADYQRYNMAACIERWRSNNTSAGPIHVLEPVSGSYRGTADAVYQNLGYLRRYGVERVLVLAGDHVYKMDYRKMLAFHEKMGADVTVGVMNVPVEQAHRFGAVMTDTEGRITDFIEKSSVPRSNLVSMGMYVFNTEALARRLIEDAAQPDSPHDFGYAIIPSMVSRDRAFAFKFDGYWQDIGTIEAYYSANMELTREKPAFGLGGDWSVFGEGCTLPPARISPQASVLNSVIGPGCVVKGRVENSILSPGVWVEEEAVVTKSILMANSFIGYHSVVESCVVDEGVSVGKFSYVGFRGTATKGDPEVTVLGKGATVPAHTAIGCNCRVLPNVAQTDFTTSMVPSGTVVPPWGGGVRTSAGERVVVP